MKNRVPLEALLRAKGTEAILRAQGVPINPSLPVIMTEERSKRRTTDEVAYRTLGLLVVAVKGESMDQAFVDYLVREYGLEPHLTRKERAFIENESPSDQDRTNFIWRYEAAWTLLWALGYVDGLGKPEATCDVPQAVTFVKGKTAEQFIAGANLRPLARILDQADLIYRYDW